MKEWADFGCRTCLGHSYQLDPIRLSPRYLAGLRNLRADIGEAVGRIFKSRIGHDPAL
jgi:hypothetical protein